LTVLTAERGLSVSGLSARAGSFTLGPVSLDVPADRVLVVLGPSGAGKTMLLETIAGLRPQQAGQISLAGTDITGLPPERRRIGLVFQDAALFPHLTVRDNVRFGPRARHAASPDGSDDLLQQLGIERLAGRSPRSLSGGERQRVALARALAIQPGLLLLDEPLSALDQPTREEMRALLQKLLAELEIPAAHVTHDRDEALSLGDDLAVIVSGQLRQTGPAASVAAEPADGSLTAPVERIIHTRPLARITLGCDPPVAALMLHRDINRLQLTAGHPVQVNMPPGGLRVFRAKDGKEQGSAPGRPR
jgi:ABC-type Fe3+/spermidine/putrescine transport system ATPase subunit